MHLESSLANAQVTAQLALSNLASTTRQPTQKEEMLAGRQYFPFDEVVLERERCSVACWRFSSSTNPTNSVYPEGRARLFRDILQPLEHIISLRQLHPYLPPAGPVIMLLPRHLSTAVMDKTSASDKTWLLGGTAPFWTPARSRLAIGVILDRMSIFILLHCLLIQREDQVQEGRISTGRLLLILMLDWRRCNYFARSGNWVLLHTQRPSPQQMVATACSYVHLHNHRHLVSPQQEWCP